MNMEFVIKLQILATQFSKFFQIDTCDLPPVPSWTAERAIEALHAKPLKNELSAFAAPIATIS